MKKLLHYIPLQVSVFLALGILLGYHLFFSFQFIVTAFLCLFGVLVFLYIQANKTFIRNAWFMMVTFLLFFCIGVFNVNLHQENRYKKHYSHRIQQTNTLKIVITDVLKSNTYYNVYYASILEINSEKTFGKILVSLQKDSLQMPFIVDDLIVVKTAFNIVEKPKNPFDFDYQAYLAKQQVTHQITLRKGMFLQYKNKYLSLKGMAFTFRSKINKALNRYKFDKEVLGIINAMLLGQRQGLSTHIRQQYANAGVIHILAVSGLHVGIIMWLLSVLLLPLTFFKNGKTIRLVVIIVLLWLFAFVAGLSASVVRAVTMFTAVAIGLFSGRKTNVYQTLVMSFFILLLIRPMYLFSVGFQLSYLAVFSIVSLQPMLSKIWKPKVKVLQYFWNITTVSVAAQIGVLPLSIYYFHQFPVLFFISNLVIIPFLGFILGFGMLVIILAYINLLPIAFEQLYNTVIVYLNTFIAFMAHQERFLIRQISLSLSLLLLLYIAMFFCIIYFKRKFVSFLQAALFSLFLFFLLAIFQKYKAIHLNQWIVFHKNKQTIIGKKIGGNFYVNTSEDSLQSIKNKSLLNYKIGAQIQQISFDTISKNVFSVFDKTLLIVDSLGVYYLPSFKPDMVLLHQSPKINLERLINTLQPSLIIVDGSNYRSYIEHWAFICRQQKTPFYATSKKGAYVLTKK